MNWVNENAKIAYEMLIANGSPERLEGYCERHHIVPRSMGGTDEPENLTYVTASTHLYLHYWLWAGTGDDRMGHAYFSMANTNWEKYDATPLVTGAMVQAYEKAKIASAEALTQRQIGEKNHMFGRTGDKHPNFGKTVSVETRAKISAANAGEKNSMFGRTGDKHPMFGKTSPNKGKTGSLSTSSKNILMKLDCGLTLSYGSGAEAARCLGLNQSTISRRCTKGIKGFSYATNNDVSTTG